MNREKRVDLKITPKLSGGDRLRQWLTTRYQTKFKSIEEESKRRIAGNELAMFSHPAIRFGVFLAAMLAFLSILHFSRPPELLTKQLAGKNLEYRPNVELCFGQNCLADSKQIHKLSLPFFDLKSLAGFQEHDLFYRITVDRKPSELANQDTLFLPLVWGDAQIYRDGILLSSGPNLQPLIPLPTSHHEITVHVLNPSGRKFGIRGTFAPFLTDRQLAREVEKTLQNEPFQSRSAFIAQLSGMCLLLIMFLTFPYRPELFAFLVFFAIETLKAQLVLVYNMGSSVVSPQTDAVLEGVLVVAGALASVFFLSLFFRRSYYTVVHYLATNLIRIFATIGAGVMALVYLGPLTFKDAFFTTAWLCALGMSVDLTRHSLAYLYTHRLFIRLGVSSSALAALTYWVAANVRDVWVYETAITSVGYNHLHFFFVMACILAFEIGRTEIKIKEAFALLPREVVRLIHDRRTQWREGYVVLVDVVDWSAQLALLDEADTPEFIQKVNEYLLSYFDESASSVASGTGDGFYFTLEAPASEFGLSRLVKICEALATRRPTYSELGIQLAAVKDAQIRVRSAIAYGRYFTGVAEVKFLKRDYTAGFLMTALARVIGNDSDPSGPRILAGSALDQFNHKNMNLVQKTKGITVTYWKAS
ncbi:MAG: hypothetical protein AB7F86_05670 [Bdellovibrionales bacterium]